jgi:hypothetical protein
MKKHESALEKELVKAKANLGLREFQLELIENSIERALERGSDENSSRLSLEMLSEMVKAYRNWKV